MSDAGVCPSCGRPLDEHDRHVRFVLPQPVLEAEQETTTPSIWLSHSDANSSVMMQVPGVGAFVRALLPVQLTGGYTVTFGLWLAVHPDDLQRAFRVWWEPDYANLVLDGRIANVVPPWGLLAKPVRAVVRDTEETPYCDHSSDADVARVLSDEWPHPQILDALPGS
jgi:hypothetical protein